MIFALCGDCKDFFRRYHDEKLRRFRDSPQCERAISKVLEAGNSGCQLCEAIHLKFRSLQADLLSVAQTNALPIVFRLLIRPDYDTNLQWDEDIDRPFLCISASQQETEFRLWRVPDSHTAEGAGYQGYGTGSEASFVRAKEWLRECLLKHDNCNGINAPKNWVPSRLIDVGSRHPFSDTVKLIQTKGWQSPIQYAALSHCWGAVQPLRLLQSNLEALMGGISMVTLPKTFQDAVYATRKFGIQYLWIDSLCIIQDSEKDWDFESSLMTYVYGGCLLNIAAASSNDCTGGLFQNRPPSYLGSCFISLVSSFDAYVSYYQLWDQAIWPTDFESAKLNTRAWVMQERMLSPRTLAFAKAQVFWECRCKRACEEFPSEYPSERSEKQQGHFEQPQLQDKIKTYSLNLHADSRLGQDHIPRLSHAWHNLVMLYSRKDITFDQDKLVAVSGLATLFAEQMGIDYFAGLWKPTLLKDLLWEADADESANGRPRDYQAPSWSWASVKCPVTYVPGWIKSDEVTVIHIETQTMSPTSQFGRVSGGHLQLQGKLFSGLCVVSNGGPGFSLKKYGSKDNALVADFTPDERVGSEDSQAELLCLPIGSYIDTTRAIGNHCECKGLVLIKTQDERTGYYKRCGVFEATQSAFFKNPHNQAPSNRYIEDEENMIVIL